MSKFSQEEITETLDDIKCRFIEWCKVNELSNDEDKTGIWQQRFDLPEGIRIDVKITKVK